MIHYICNGGCSGVAEEPGTCQAETCDNWGEPLDPCQCADGIHQEPEEKMEKEDGEESGEMEQ